MFRSSLLSPLFPLFPSSARGTSSRKRESPRSFSIYLITVFLFPRLFFSQAKHERKTTKEQLLSLCLSLCSALSQLSKNDSNFSCSKNTREERKKERKNPPKKTLPHSLIPLSLLSSLALLRAVDGRGRRRGSAAATATANGRAAAGKLLGGQRADLLEQLGAGAAERGQQRVGDRRRGREGRGELLVADGVVDLGPDEAVFCFCFGVFERERKER